MQILVLGARHLPMPRDVTVHTEESTTLNASPDSRFRVDREQALGGFSYLGFGHQSRTPRIRAIDSLRDRYLVIFNPLASTFHSALESESCDTRP